MMKAQHISTYVLSLLHDLSVKWLRCVLEDQEFKSWQQQENYLFSRTSKN